LLAHADVAAFASQWAADSALAHYDAEPGRVHVLPMGANIDAPPSRDLVEAAWREKEARAPVRLLWIGTDWERKGGELAVRATERLRERGVDARLTVVGTVPPGEVPPWVAVVPFVDKSEARGRQQFEELLLSAHAFLLPTQMECFGIVFCEAAAFGVPSIATNVGGVSSAVAHGTSGLLVPGGSDSDAYADALMGLLAPERYRALSQGARAHYERTVNWKTASARLLDLLEAAASRS
jgi:glycosyltransferase involved in cell wall biosynthesis